MDPSMSVPTVSGAPPAASGAGQPVAADLDLGAVGPGRQRHFRPDIEGLRGLAVAVVVLYHAGIGGFSGGYVGVDVFYVISGFVITGLLLRQVGRYGRPRFIEFYARRARRILPAAGLVVIVTLVLSYAALGFIRGNEISDDARWVAVFLGNYHFAAEGTNYFQSQLPPSPLQNYWSLSIEEQFYVFYPLAITGLVLVFRRLPITVKLLGLTSAVFVVSFAWSVHYTTADPTGAYFSLWTRAWELALGGLLAAGAQWFCRLGAPLRSMLGWAGLGAIVAGVVWFSASTLYPGWIAVLPVGGAGLVILAGLGTTRFGPEVVLSSRPFRWVGKLSFSIYLWHWPILAIATQDSSHPLPLAHRLGLVALSVVAAALTFYLLENPVRNSRWLARHPRACVAMGLAIIAVMLVVATVEIHLHPGTI
jgi:peptidoglycan/LPS O-acetylase OafA/YrhL